MGTLNNDEEAATVDSSSDDEFNSYSNTFPNGSVNGGTERHREEELVVMKNTDYLVTRCASLMQRLQGIVQGTAANHLAKQLQSLVDNPVFRTNGSQKNSSFQHHIPPSHRFTKQDISEVDYGTTVIKNIIRHSMGQELDLNADSATEESEPDDDELVLPDERLQDVAGNVDNAQYLPVENNPFINVVKLEKQYEARRTFLDRSINECEFSLNKSIALKRHCKGRKPLFQLEKPSTSSNSSSINQVSQVRESETRYVGTDVSHVYRVSEMINSRRPSLDEKKVVNGETGESSGSESAAKSEKISEKSQPGTSSQESKPETSTKTNGTGENERNAFIPTIKTMSSDGSSVLGVEFCSKSDPTQISSRCVAIKRPEKNRKVFQLGGIQNIFRDADRLPTLRCTCFGRHELCALCLGRAKKKAEINHVHMSFKDKLAILDETFHKNLSFPEDVPLEAILASTALGNNLPIMQTTELQEILRQRARQFPPDVLHTGPRPKKPRSFNINEQLEAQRSPKKDSRFNEETPHSPRKRQNTRKSQSFEEKDNYDMAGKGFGWPNRERKDSQSVSRRSRNQEFDIDNIVIPYSMAATTRVEQLVYKPIETPRWRVLEPEEIFANMSEESSGEMDDMSDAAFIVRHAKCEVEEKKRFSQSLQKALNATRKTRRLDSTCRNDGELTHDENSSSSHPLLSPDKTRDKDSGNPFFNSADGTTTPDPSTVITEAMANQALKSLFKVGNRRRTASTSVKVEEEVEDTTPTVVVEPWPARKFPLPDDEYKEMLESMEQCYAESALDYVSFQTSHLDDPPSSPNYLC